MGSRPCAIICVLLSCACGTTRREQLQRVAKDWCETIRASQVIPVYPLTEDLQPGDVFLVQQTVEEQHRVYEEDGFLPLDNHLGRVNPTGYKVFYERSFGAPEALPKDWLTASPAWTAAPTAAFPSYNFATQKGGGFNVAVPVSGIAVGLSLLGSQAAAGTVTISDARTLGIDTDSLYQDVLHWAIDHHALLEKYGTEPDSAEPNYLRVVSRVYLVGKMTVSLQETRSFGAGATGGASRPVELLAAETVRSGDENKPQEITNASVKNYKDNLKTLNEAIGSIAEDGKLVPGGQAKVVSASARSITLDETFKRPLVVGYVGFDMQILRGGALGPPIPSHSVIALAEKPEEGTAFFTVDEQQYLRAMRRARRADVEAWRSILNSLDPALVGQFETRPDYPHFRELVASWLTGAVSDMRKAAATQAINKEIRGKVPDTGEAAEGATDSAEGGSPEGGQ